MANGMLKRLFPVQFAMSWREAAYSALGAALAIAANAAISHALLPVAYHIYLAASMGASTILVTVLYHSPLSQPWAVLGGHLVAVGAGLASATLLGDPVAAAAMALALTVILQILLRCLHAPGGGTAMLPVLGGAPLLAEGIGFALVVLLNSVVLLLIALTLNNILPGRRYPLSLAPSPNGGFSEEEMREALDSMPGFIDITPDDLARIYDHARQHHRRPGQ